MEATDLETGEFIRLINQISSQVDQQQREKQEANLVAMMNSATLIGVLKKVLVDNSKKGTFGLFSFRYLSHPLTIRTSLGFGNLA